MKIFVGNISPEVNEEELNTLFSEHGNISYIKIVRDSSGKISRGFGYVEMPRKVDAKKALKFLNEFEFRGKKMIVNEVKPRHDSKNAGKRKNPGRKKRW